MNGTRVSPYAWYVAVVLMLTYAVQHNGSNSGSTSR